MTEVILGERAPATSPTSGRTSSMATQWAIGAALIIGPTSAFAAVRSAG